MYCKKCGSRLYPIDSDYISAAGVCSFCVTTDRPDGAYRRAWVEFTKPRGKAQKPIYLPGRKRAVKNPAEL